MHFVPFSGFTILGAEAIRMPYLIVNLPFRWKITQPIITITVITVIFLIPPSF